MVSGGPMPSNNMVDMDTSGSGGVKDPLPVTDRSLWLKHEQEAYMQTMKLKR